MSISAHVSEDGFIVLHVDDSKNTICIEMQLGPAVAAGLYFDLEQCLKKTGVATTSGYNKEAGK